MIVIMDTLLIDTKGVIEKLKSDNPTKCELVVDVTMLGRSKSEVTVYLNPNFADM